MKTYQDFEKAPDVIQFICAAINDHRQSDKYKTAVIADEYERQQNTTIRQFVKYLYDEMGRKAVDFTSSNNKLCNNFFHRLNKQRCSYLLGNGIEFTEDGTKKKLGKDFDTDLYHGAYYALIHGECYLFWNKDRLHVFPVTEFCPLYDEETGRLRAGIRFWSLDWGNRPVDVVLYTEDGYTRYRTKPESKGLDLMEYTKQRAYKQRVAISVADGEEVVGESNYGSLPIVPIYGNRNKQSTLIGMRDKLDSYDMIQSGFANDLQDCAEIYWIVSNGMGMSNGDLAKFRDRLKLQHIAVADMDGSDAKPYAQDIPFEARKAFLENIRNSIFEDFGALDVHTISAGTTNDHIDAAYQPVDEEADDFEYQVIQAVRQILALIGIDDVPQFKRNRISNQKEQTEMVMSTADVIDPETIIEKLPWITVDEKEEVLKRMDAEKLADKRNMEKWKEAMNDEDGENGTEDRRNDGDNGG